jgi:hypothetical protein
MLSSGFVLAVALVAGLSEAPAQSTKKTTTAPPPKPTSTTTKPPPKTNPPGPKTNPPGPKTNPPGPKTDPPGPKTNPPGPEGPKPNEPLTYQPHSTVPPKNLPNGDKEYRDPKSNLTIRTDPQGQVKHIEAQGLTGKTVINRGPGGGRIVETGRPGARIVSYGSHRGFVERSLPGRPGYISRTYVVGGRSYVSVYHEYRYGGLVYYNYVPAFYYGPAFYGWVSSPWAPVPYFWGNGITAPWFGVYAGYFAPSPVYASPEMWLTDNLLAENLRAAYENQQEGNGGQVSQPPAQSSQPTTATLDEIKPLIAEEVRQQLAAERAAAQPTSSNPQPPAAGTEQLPPALNQKFFVVSSNLDVNVAAQTCPLTPGDVIQRTGKLTPDGSVPVEVESSKPGDCPRDSATAVQLADLQEMHNKFREQIDSGLKMLAENRAKGLPGGPAALARPVAEGTADQATDAVAQLEAQRSTADNLEARVSQGGN